MRFVVMFEWDVLGAATSSPADDGMMHCSQAAVWRGNPAYVNEAVPTPHRAIMIPSRRWSFLPALIPWILPWEWEWVHLSLAVNIHTHICS